MSQTGDGTSEPVTAELPPSAGSPAEREALAAEVEQLRRQRDRLAA